MKKGLNKEQVLKRLANAEKKHLVESKKTWKKYYSIDQTFQEYINARLYRPSMKYFKRLEIFKGSNHDFDPKTLIATSYDWWTFVQVIKGKLVFNDYRYSNSTSRHQRHVSRLLEELGIKVDLTVDVHQSLSSLSSDSVKRKLDRIFELESKVKYGREENVTWRKRSIRSLEKEIKMLKTLGVSINKKEVNKMRETFHTNETKRRETRKADLKAQKELVKQLATKKETFTLELGA